MVEANTDPAVVTARIERETKVVLISDLHDRQFGLDCRCFAHLVFLLVVVGGYRFV